MKVPFFDLNYGPEETAAVVAALESRWISMGPRCEELEKQFAAMHGAPHGIALANCTAALHLALRILDVQPGDEVIVPSLTFVATASVVRMQGATPVFADITSLDDWTLSLADVERKLTPRTKAILPMHYGGFGADMPRLCALARDRGLKIVEDACHAPLGFRDGRFLGTYGDFACYSFYSNKNMATGEGGLMLTTNAEYAARGRARGGPRRPPPADPPPRGGAVRARGGGGGDDRVGDQRGVCGPGPSPAGPRYDRHGLRPRAGGRVLRRGGLGVQLPDG